MFIPVRNIRSIGDTYWSLRVRINEDDSRGVLRTTYLMVSAYRHSILYAERAHYCCSSYRGGGAGRSSKPSPPKKKHPIQGALHHSIDLGFPLSTPPYLNQSFTQNTQYSSFIYAKQSWNQAISCLLLQYLSSRATRPWAMSSISSLILIIAQQNLRRCVASRHVTYGRVKAFVFTSLWVDVSQ